MPSELRTNSHSSHPYGSHSLFEYPRKTDPFFIPSQEPSGSPCILPLFQAKIIRPFLLVGGLLFVAQFLGLGRNLCHGLLAFATVLTKQVLLTALPNLLFLAANVCRDDYLDGIIVVAIAHNFTAGPAFANSFFGASILLLAPISVGGLCTCVYTPKSNIDNRGNVRDNDSDDNDSHGR